MLTGLEESPITQLLQILWRGRSALGNSSVTEDIQIGTSIPHTVVYEHNFPKGLFHSGLDGNLMRRVGKEIDSKIVFRVFSEQTAPGDSAKQPRKAKTSSASMGVPGTPSRDPSGACDIVAVYTEKGEDNVYSAQYFTDAALRAFLLGATAETSASGAQPSNPPDFVDLHPVASKNGILQKFVYPVGPHSEMIQVLWTPHVCIAEKLRSCMLLGDLTKTPFQRAATIEAPANFNTRAYVSPATAEAIRHRCEALVDQLYVVERRLVSCMTLYFKVDEQGTLWLLWCAYLRFLPQKSLRPVVPASSIRSSPQAGQSQHHNTAPSSSMVPRFVLPRSCAGDFAGRAALFLAKNDTAQRANKPILGTDGKDMQVMYHVTRDMSFESMNEDSVLKRRLPSLTQRCLSAQRADAVFVPPTRSKLCPQMRWLRGPLSLDFQRRTLFDAQDAARTAPEVHPSMAAPAGAIHAKSEPSMMTVGTPMPSRAQSPSLLHSTPGTLTDRKFSMRDLTDLMQARAKPKGPCSIIDILRSPEKMKAIGAGGGGATDVSHISATEETTAPDDSLTIPFQSLCDSPPRRRAVESLTSTQCEGDLHWEMLLLRDLCRAPVHPTLLKDPQLLERMVALKTSLEVAAQFLSQLRDACSGHFALFPTVPSMGVTCPPFAFSVPTHWIESTSVSERLVEMLRGCRFAPLSMQEAVTIDKAAGRSGWCDHCSTHHQLAAQHRLAEASRQREAELEVDPTPAAAAATVDAEPQPSAPPLVVDALTTPPTVPCFCIADACGQTKLMSKIPHFIAVTLRTMHADMETALCAQCS